MEIKCPYAGRREKIKPGKNFSFLEMREGETDVFQLKRSHPYYYQVTAEMMLARKSTCYFAVYTLAPDMFIEKISLNDTFFMTEMLPKLQDFFEQHYLPIAVAEIAK